MNTDQPAGPKRTDSVKRSTAACLKSDMKSSSCAQNRWWQESASSGLEAPTLRKKDFSFGRATTKISTRFGRKTTPMVVSSKIVWRWRPLVSVMAHAKMKLNTWKLFVNCASKTCLYMYTRTYNNNWAIEQFLHVVYRNGFLTNFSTEMFFILLLVWYNVPFLRTS